MKINSRKLNPKKITVFLVEDFSSDEGKVYKISGTAKWKRSRLWICDVDWGEDFNIPEDLIDLICPADKHTRNIVPDAEYVMCMPMTLYPNPRW